MSQGVCDHSSVAGQSEYVLLTFDNKYLYDAYLLLMKRKIAHKAVTMRINGEWFSGALCASIVETCPVLLTQGYLAKQPLAISRANARGHRQALDWATGQFHKIIVESKLDARGTPADIIKDVRTQQEWTMTDKVSTPKAGPALQSLSRKQKLYARKRNTAIVPGVVLA